MASRSLAQRNEESGEREPQAGEGANDFHGIFREGYAGTVKAIKDRLEDRCTLETLKLETGESRAKASSEVLDWNVKEYKTFDGESGKRVDEEYKKSKDTRDKFIKENRMTEEKEGEGKKENEKAEDVQDIEFLMGYRMTVENLQKRLEDGMTDVQDKFKVGYKMAVRNLKNRLEKGNTVERKEKKSMDRGDTIIVTSNDTGGEFIMEYTTTVKSLQRRLEEGMADAQDTFIVDYGMVAEGRENQEGRKESKKSKERGIEFRAEYRQTVKSLQKRLDFGVADVQGKFSMGYKMAVENMKNRFEEGTRDEKDIRNVNIGYMMKEDRKENKEGKRTENSKDVRDESDLEFMEYRMTAQSIQKILEEGIHDVQELFTVEYRMVVENLKKRLEEGPKPSLSTPGRGKSKEMISEPLQKQSKGSLEKTVSKNMLESQRVRGEEEVMRHAVASAETRISESKATIAHHETPVFSTYPKRRPPGRREKTTSNVVDFVIIVVLSFLVTLFLTSA